MKLQKIKLNKLAENSLANREMKELKGGNYCCSCSCAYANNGGSSIDANRDANMDYGYHSRTGSNSYIGVVVTP